MDIDRPAEQMPAWLGDWLSDMDSGQVPADDLSGVADEGIPDVAITAPDNAVDESWDTATGQPLELPNPYDLGPSFEQPTEPEVRPSFRGFVQVIEPEPMEPKVDMTEIDPGLVSDIRRPNILTKGQLEIAQAADAAAAEGYEIWSDVTGEAVESIKQTSGYCKEISIVTGGILRATTGMNTRLLQYFPNWGGPGRGWHFLLETQTGIPDGELELDFTWKQMIEQWEKDPAYDDKPDVLAVPRLELPPALSAHKIPASHHNIWTEAIPMRWDWRDFPRQGLKSAMITVYKRYGR